MGERALALENANQGDIAADARASSPRRCEAGAFGFSTSRTISHKTLKGDPTPTLRAQEEELTGIAMGLKDAGAGFLEFVSDWNSRTRRPNSPCCAAWSRSLRPARGLLADPAARPAPRCWKELLALSNKAAAEGVSIRPVFPPRPIGILMGLLGSQNPFSGAPSYKAIAHLPVPERVAAMRDPETRARILSEDRFGGSNFPLITRLPSTRMFPFGDPPDYAAAARPASPPRPRARAAAPEDVAYDMLLADDGQSFIFCAADQLCRLHLDASAELLRHPNTIVGLSDGGAHVGFISDGSFPTSC